MPAQRAPSVQAPPTTTHRAGTPAPIPVPVPNSGTGRVRTQWTGNLSVPQHEEDQPKRRSKLPLIIGGVVLAAGAAIAAVVIVGGSKKPQETPGIAPGSQIVAITADAPVAAPPDAATVLPPLPKEAKIRIETTPSGAEIRDRGELVGRTPMTFKVTPSHNPRQFTLRLKGYGDHMVELTPNEPTILRKETLELIGSTTVKRGRAGTSGRRGDGGSAGARCGGTRDQDAGCRHRRLPGAAVSEDDARCRQLR